ncbi:MAG: hypothetical protein ABJA94_08350 [Rhodoglobus sp.]
MPVTPESAEPATAAPTEVIATAPATAAATSAPTVAAAVATAAAPKLSRPVLATIIALGAALLVAIIVIVAVVVPKGSTTVADAPIVPAPSASPSLRPSATPSPTATPKPTKTPDALVPAPAPVVPAPVDPVPAPVDPVPAPADPPALPPPPAPVIPTPTITAMNTYYSGVCTTSTTIAVSWASTNGTSATMNLRSGGGSPIINQTWTSLQATGSQSFLIDCTRPIWFFTLTVENSAHSTWGRLTFANGSNVGWTAN